MIDFLFQSNNIETMALFQQNERNKPISPLTSVIKNVNHCANLGLGEMDMY